MAAHSSILAWRIPRTEEPGKLESMALQRVGHNLATKQQNNNNLLKKKLGICIGPVLHQVTEVIGIFLLSWLKINNTKIYHFKHFEV